MEAGMVRSLMPVMARILRSISKIRGIVLPIIIKQRQGTVQDSCKATGWADVYDGMKADLVFQMCLPGSFICGTITIQDCHIMEQIQAADIAWMQNGAALMPR